MASVIDVARHAGTSTATVSRVFNGSADVRPETRERVVAAATALGYRPDASARNLRRRRSGLETLKYTIGILFADSNIFATNPFNLELLAGVEGALRARGYGIRLITSRAAVIPPEVQSGEIDGIIIQEIGRAHV
jgi:LacI family transcriptional regulator